MRELRTSRSPARHDGVRAPRAATLIGVEPRALPARFPRHARHGLRPPGQSPGPLATPFYRVLSRIRIVPGALVRECRDQGIARLTLACATAPLTPAYAALPGKHLGALGGSGKGTHRVTHSRASPDTAGCGSPRAGRYGGESELSLKLTQDARAAGTARPLRRMPRLACWIGRPVDDLTALPSIEKRVHC